MLGGSDAAAAATEPRPLRTPVCAPGGSARSPPPRWSCSTASTAAPHDEQAPEAVTDKGSVGGGGAQLVVGGGQAAAAGEVEAPAVHLAGQSCLLGPGEPGEVCPQMGQRFWTCQPSRMMSCPSSSWAPYQFST